MRTNCPNCGAPIKQLRTYNCEYCGTLIQQENIKKLEDYELVFKKAELQRSMYNYSHILTIICKAIPKFNKYDGYDNWGNLYIKIDNDLLKNDTVGINIEIEPEILYKLEHADIDELCYFLKSCLPIPYHRAIPGVIRFLNQYFKKGGIYDY